MATNDPIKGCSENAVKMHIVATVATTCNPPLPDVFPASVSQVCKALIRNLTSDSSSFGISSGTSIRYRLVELAFPGLRHLACLKTYIDGIQALPYGDKSNLRGLPLPSAGDVARVSARTGRASRHRSMLVPLAQDSNSGKAAEDLLPTLF